MVRKSYILNNTIRLHLFCLLHKSISLLLPALLAWQGYLPPLTGYSFVHSNTGIHYKALLMCKFLILFQSSPCQPFHVTACPQNPHQCGYTSLFSPSPQFGQSPYLIPVEALFPLILAGTGSCSLNREIALSHASIALHFLLPVPGPIFINLFATSNPLMANFMSITRKPPLRPPAPVPGRTMHRRPCTALRSPGLLMSA